MEQFFSQIPPTGAQREGRLGDAVGRVRHHQRHEKTAETFALEDKCSRHYARGTGTTQRRTFYCETLIDKNFFDKVFGCFQGDMQLLMIAPRPDVAYDLCDYVPLCKDEEAIESANIPTQQSILLIFGF